MRESKLYTSSIYLVKKADISRASQSVMMLVPGQHGDQGNSLAIVGITQITIATWLILMVSQALL